MFSPHTKEMTNMDAHHSEYLGAVAAMQETYGTDTQNEFAVGDHISFRLKGWSDSSYDDGRVCSHHNGKLLVETAIDIVEVDPRPWPVGNVLPF
jgi:hypothetical protein